VFSRRASGAHARVRTIEEYNPSDARRPGDGRGARRAAWAYERGGAMTPKVTIYTNVG
jgi:hypothetical protein